MLTVLLCVISIVSKYYTILKYEHVTISYKNEFAYLRRVVRISKRFVALMTIE